MTQADEVKARTDDATQLKASLKKLNQMTDDTIMMVNTERVQRVKAETGEAVMRHAKQTFLNDRWNRADELRAQMEELRRRQRANEQQYMDHAHQTKQRAKQATDLAHKMQKEAQMQEALELRGHGRSGWRPSTRQARRPRPIASASSTRPWRPTSSSQTTSCSGPWRRWQRAQRRQTRSYRARATRGQLRCSAASSASESEAAATT